MKIGVIAPANSMFYIDRSLIDKGIARLEQLGFHVVFGKYVNNIHRYTAGTVNQRLEDIENFLNDDSVDIIMSVYGGNNSNQLLDRLDYKLIKEKRKIFVGFSDITAILCAINKKTALKTLLGPALISFCREKLYAETIEIFIKILNGNKNIALNAPKNYSSLIWDDRVKIETANESKHPGWKYLRPGKATAKVIGGNFETLMALAGTEFFPETKDKILVIEDESHISPQVFDRQIIQLKQMRVFDEISGLIIGQFSLNSKLSDIDFLQKIVLDNLKTYDFPIVVNANFSHVDPIYTLILGGKITLIANDDDVSVTINDSIND